MCCKWKLSISQMSFLDLLATYLRTIALGMLNWHWQNLVGMSHAHAKGHLCFIKTHRVLTKGLCLLTWERELLNSYGLHWISSVTSRYYWKVPHLCLSHIWFNEMCISFDPCIWTYIDASFPFGLSFGLVKLGQSKLLLRQLSNILCSIKCAPREMHMKISIKYTQVLNLAYKDTWYNQVIISAYADDKADGIPH